MRQRGRRRSSASWRRIASARSGSNGWRPRGCCTLPRGTPSTVPTAQPNQPYPGSPRPGWRGTRPKMAAGAHPVRRRGSSSPWLCRSRSTSMRRQPLPLGSRLRRAATLTAAQYGAFAVIRSLDPLSLGHFSPIFSPFFPVFSPFSPSGPQDSRNRHQDPEKRSETVAKRSRKGGPKPFNRKRTVMPVLVDTAVSAPPSVALNLSPRKEMKSMTCAGEASSGVASSGCSKATPLIGP